MKTNKIRIKISERIGLHLNLSLRIERLVWVLEKKREFGQENKNLVPKLIQILDVIIYLQTLKKVYKRKRV